MTKRRFGQLTQPGWAILIATVILSTIGVMCIVAAQGQPTVPAQAAVKQIVFVAISVIALLIITRFGYARLGRVAYVLFFLSLLLLLPSMMARLVGPLPLVPRINGTYRWIVLPGFRLQPSELMKFSFVLGLAWYLRHKESYRQVGGLLGPFVLTIIPMFLILLQPDLGTAMLMMPVLLVMLVAAGARIRHLAVIAALALACVPFFWLKMQDYQRLRIAGLALQNETLRSAIVQHPEKWSWFCDADAARQWEQSSGFQLIRSKGALGSGRVWGNGWRQGTYVQYNFLTFKHNDFIFPLVGQQWGLIGCVVVLLCYLIIVLAGLEIAIMTHDPFGRLLCVGVVALLGTQVLINVGMTMGLAPITGMTLPFVSAGGSSMLTSFFLIAVLISVSQHRPYMLARRPFEGPQAGYVGIG